MKYLLNLLLAPYNYMEKIYIHIVLKYFKATTDLAMFGKLHVPPYQGTLWEPIVAESKRIRLDYQGELLEDFNYIGYAGTGDCDEWSIAFIENNIRAGNFPKNSVKWVFGKEENGIKHYWVVVTLKGESRLFDNRGNNGVLTHLVYSRGYKEIFTLYTY